MVTDCKLGASRVNPNRCAKYLGFSNSFYRFSNSFRYFVRSVCWLENYRDLFHTFFCLGLCFCYVQWEYRCHRMTRGDECNWGHSPLATLAASSAHSVLLLEGIYVLEGLRKSSALRKYVKCLTYYFGLNRERGLHQDAFQTFRHLWKLFLFLLNFSVEKKYEKNKTKYEKIIRTLVGSCRC